MIDDAEGRTVAAASTLDKGAKGTSGANIEAATNV
ncbi:50S ribosomal protein L18, partial [Acinetobacter baumannii]